MYVGMTTCKLLTLLFLFVCYGVHFTPHHLNFCYNSGIIDTRYNNNANLP